MNETTLDEETIASADPRIEMQERPCGDWTNALLCAIGTGIAIGLIVRALRPAPSRTERLAHLIEDLEDRLRETARPALRKASAYAAGSADVLRDGLHTGEALLERGWRDAARGVRRLFS